MKGGVSCRVRNVIRVRVDSRTIEAMQNSRVVQMSDSRPRRWHGSAAVTGWQRSENKMVAR